MTVLKILRSLVSGNRPTTGHVYGEPYVNFADMQLGVMNSSNIPIDFLGVPMFSSGTNYPAGQPVVVSGALYISIVPITAGAFNPTQWIQLQTASLGFPGGGGRLTYGSATALAYLPFGNPFLRVNTTLMKIPSSGGGVTGLSNTGIYLNGSPGGNLASNTTYYVFVFNNAGVPTADFYPIGGTTTHGPSTKSQNEGTEVRFVSGTEDPTRSLIGMVGTSGSSQFQDDGLTRAGVATWYNRRFRNYSGYYTGAVTGIGTTTPTILGSFFGMLHWADAPPLIHYTGIIQNNTVGQQTFFQAMIDSNTSGGVFTPTPRSPGTDTNYFTMGGSSAPLVSSAPLAEGYHTYSFGGWVAGGTGSIAVQIGGGAFI